MAPTLKGSGWLRDIVLINKNWSIQDQDDIRWQNIPETGHPETGQPETGHPEVGHPETGHAVFGFVQGIFSSILRNGEISKGSVVLFRNPVMESGRVIKRVASLRPVSEEKHALNVQGDNQEISIDSRIFGEINQGLVLGKAVAILWPPNRAQWL